MTKKSVPLPRPVDFRGTLIVHVGTHKTGSTSIQAYCMDNYDMLRQDGYLYPRAGRIAVRGQEVINHHPLIVNDVTQGFPSAFVTVLAMRRSTHQVHRQRTAVQCK